MSRDDRHPGAWRPLLLICLLAAVVRIASAALLPNVAYPDETFQFLEPAHDLITGQGMTAWEYAVGARSWLVPGVFAALMAPLSWAGASPEAQVAAVTAAMIALSLAGVWGSFTLGLRAAGLRGAIAAGLVAALWCELVYLSTHPLADTISAAFLLWGLALVYKRDGPDRVVAYFAAGLLLGIAAVTRMQLAPALAVAVLGLGGRRPARYVAMVLGGIVPVAALGVVDWLTWGAPYRSIYVYLLTNTSGIADHFGRSPVYGYLQGEAKQWTFAAPLVLGTAVLGARRLPLVALVGAAVLLTFSLIGHKEPRFVYPALPLLFTLCGVGAAEAARLLAERTARAAYALPAILVLFAVASAGGAVGHRMKPLWTQNRAILLAMHDVNRDPAACGLGFAPYWRWYTTGHVRLRGDLTLYDAGAEAPPGASRAFNYLLTATPETSASGFQRLRCTPSDLPYTEGDQICLFRRPGACEAAAARPLGTTPGPEVTAILRRLKLNWP